MADWYEIDFMGVEADKSGDAIPLRYSINGQTYIHVVDAGFQGTGESVVRHIRRYYGSPTYIDHVIATHPDGDHTGGLRAVLEEFEIGRLWMLRPWNYAAELLPRFEHYRTVAGLAGRLREVYKNIAALEDIAVERGIAMCEPFQGERIGAFTVLAPARARYLDLVVASERTPEAVEETNRSGIGAGGLGMLIEHAARKVETFIRAAWGDEVFSPDETSAENEMSVVQYAMIGNSSIVLTADTGRVGLAEAADYAKTIGIPLPGVDRFQVPHHGSRRNVSSEVLDVWLGPRMSTRPDRETFTAICSSAKKDEAHPRKAVTRAFIHRGAKFIATEGRTICSYSGAPERPGWVSVGSDPYPEDQEE